jgi:hypothetical protein
MERPCASRPSVAARVMAAVREFGERRRIAAEHGCALHEIEDPQARSIARRPGGGQHMVRAADIIADCLGCVMPQKDRTGIADFGEQRLRLIDGELDMLGCDAVGEFDRFGDRGDGDDGAELLPAIAGDVGARQQFDLTPDFVLDEIGQPVVGGD